MTSLGGSKVKARFGASKERRDSLDDPYKYIYIYMYPGSKVAAFGAAAWLGCLREKVTTDQ